MKAENYADQISLSSKKCLTFWWPLIIGNLKLCMLLFLELVYILTSLDCSMYHNNIFNTILQKTLKTDHPERPGTSGSYSRNLVSSASIRSVPAASLPIHDSVLDRHNLGLLRPRKLTPLTPIDTLHKTNQIRIVQNNDNKQHRQIPFKIFKCSWPLEYASSGVEISIFSLYHVIVRVTKIMNRADKNWAHFWKIKYFQNQSFQKDH